MLSSILLSLCKSCSFIGAPDDANGGGGVDNDVYDDNDDVFVGGDVNIIIFHYVYGR